MALTKWRFSVTEMEAIPIPNRSVPKGAMLQRFRIQSIEREKRFQLEGFGNLNEAFFVGHLKKGTDSAGKPFREMERNEKVILLEFTKPSHSRFMKMIVIKTFSQNDVVYLGTKMLQKGAT